MTTILQHVRVRHNRFVNSDGRGLAFAEIGDITASIDNNNAVILPFGGLK